MSLKPDKEGMDVVEIASSDDEEGVGMRRSNNQQVQTQKVGQQSNERIPPSEKPLSRSFWKAGGYVITPTKLTPAPDQLEHARVHPKFLHSNATSHKWAFGAIAELLDNAVDEICNGATFVKLDKIDNQKDNSPALLFQDDGGGMDPESVRKCMSLGYSSKKSNKTIGQYGNGFKTSTMRLGADVIVFSRASRNGRATQSIGLLSYTFLRRTGQDDVIVPMVDFDISDHWAEPIIYSSEEDWSANLKTILEWSPFASKEELMQQFEDIGPHGTKVIIYNLWLNDEGIFELNFDDDDEDVRLRDEANRGSLSKVTKRTAELQSHISYRIRYSLRAYASILYLRKFTNFQIILRGKPVQQFNIADELKYPKVVIYKPQHNTALKESPNEILCKCPSAPPANRWASVETTIGFIKEAPALGVSGFNVYNKNRLIRPFWKVTSDGSSRGDGVVGVLEANFIEPAHDKQDFERSSLFIRLETKLKQMLMDYWKSNCHLMGYQPPGLRVQNTQKEHPAQSPVGHAAHVQKEFPAKQHIVGLAPNTKKAMNLDHQPISSLPATLRQEEINEQPGNRCRTSFQEESPPVPTIIGLRDGSFKEVASVDGSGFISADKICEENIQLFMRCEERRQKENELKQTISLLERELEEAKKKCAQLASRLEIKRKQGILNSVEKIL